MAFSWNFFKSKSQQAREAGREKSADSRRPQAKPARNDSAELKLGGAFVPAAFTPPAANRKNPQGSAQPDGNREIVIALGDVLACIPARLLKPGPHDSKTPLRFAAHDLVSDIARGRATVRLARIAKLCPQIFACEISDADDAAVPLPLQKLFGQIGALGSHAASSPRTSAASPIPKPTGIANGESKKPAAQQTSESARAEIKKEPTPASATIPDATPPEAEPVESDSTMRRIPAFQIPPPRFFQAATPDAAEANQNIPAIPAETSAPPGQAPTPQPAGFNQNRLQMLLITSETLDAKKVAELIAELPDVSGCLLHAGGATYRAGKVPEELEVEFFEQRALEWLGTMQALKLGTMRAFTAHGTELAATLFANVRTCLCVFHDDYGLLPGYVEKLDAVVAEVARMIAEK